MRADRLDLPLGGGAPSRERTSPLVGRSAVATRRPPSRGPRRRWPWILLLFLVLAGAAAVAAYLLVWAPPRPVVDPIAAAFEPQRVGTESDSLPLHVTNEGRRDLVVSDVTVTGEDAGAFEMRPGDCVGVSLPYRGACTVEVGFRPSRTGEHVASVQIASNAADTAVTVELAGRGTAPALAIRPERLDFGRVAVGESSAGAALELTNPGDAPLEIRRLSLDGSGSRAFRWLSNSCSDTSLGPGENCSVRLAFRPVDGGEESASVRVESDADETPRVEVHGIGLAPGLLVLPERVAFERVRLGRTGSTETVTLENTGNAPLRLGEVSVDGAGAGAFDVDSSSCDGAVLAPQGTCRLRVTLEPREEGAFRAGIRIGSPDLDRPAEVVLEGRSTAPRLRVSAQEVDFGRVVLGGSEREVLRVESVGSEPVSLSGIVAEGAGFSTAGDCRRGETLRPGSGCSLEAAFEPRSEGEATGTLRLQHDGLGGTIEIRLSGSGYPPPVASLAVAPDRLEFEPVTVGGRSEILSLRVRSTGSARLELRDLSVEGEQAGDFVMVPASCNGVPYLVPGSDCVVGFRFVPQAAGERRARVVIRSNARQSTVSVAMVGLAAAGSGG